MQVGFIRIVTRDIRGPSIRPDPKKKSENFCGYDSETQRNTETLDFATRDKRDWIQKFSGTQKFLKPKAS